MSSGSERIEYLAIQEEESFLRLVDYELGAGVEILARMLPNKGLIIAFVFDNADKCHDISFASESKSLSFQANGKVSSRRFYRGGGVSMRLCRGVDLLLAAADRLGGWPIRSKYGIHDTAAYLLSRIISTVWLACCLRGCVVVA